MAVGVEQYIIDQDDEDCPEIGLHLAAWKGDAVQLEELLTCHKDHVQVDRHSSTCQQSIYPTFVTILLDGNRVENSLSNPGNPADGTARRKEEIRKTHYTSAEDRRRTP